MSPQRDNQVKVLALLRAGHSVGEVASLVVMSCTTVFAIKKRMENGEGVNRRTGSSRKIPILRLLPTCGMPIEGLL